MQIFNSATITVRTYTNSYFLTIAPAKKYVISIKGTSKTNSDSFYRASKRKAWNKTGEKYKLTKENKV